MGYDRILKYNDDGEACESCIGLSTEELGCNQWILELKRPVMNICTAYANAAQLEGLIKEAESGGHEWVRAHALFVCEYHTSCQIEPCTLRGVGIEYIGGTMDCVRSDRTIKFLPYRGTKSDEEKTWPGKTGATHLEALKDLIERGLVPKATDEDCSEVDTNWLSKTDANGEPNAGSVMIPPKQDRSDTNYNEKKALIKDFSENVCARIVESLIEEVEKESEDMDVEYVVLKDINMDSLSIASEISDQEFRHLFMIGGMERGVGDIIFSNEALYDCSISLMAGGFIEQKVCDPVVKPGDTFISESGDLYRLMVSSGCMQTICNLNGSSHFGPSCEVRHYNDTHLSFFVGKDRLKEFTPCKIEVKIIEV